MFSGDPQAADQLAHPGWMWGWAYIKSVKRPHPLRLRGSSGVKWPPELSKREPPGQGRSYLESTRPTPDPQLYTVHKRWT